MHFDTIQLIEGTQIFNLTVAVSASLPLLGTQGELTYLTTGAPGTTGLYVFDGVTWQRVGIASAIAHETDYSMHLTYSENLLLDAIIVTATEINYLANLSGPVQTLLDAKVNSSGGSITGNLIMQPGAKITIADVPVAGTDAANKNYVDAAIAGLTWKNSAKVATTANIALSGTQTIDGIVVNVGDRVLVKNQTNTTQNGIYVVAAGAWTRATDMDQTTPLNEINSAAVFVGYGTVSANTGWTQVNNVSVLGSDSISFTQFSGTSAGSTVKVSKYSILGSLSTGVGNPRWYPETAITISGVYFSVGSAPVIGNASIDILKNGVSIMGGTYPTVLAGTNKSSVVITSMPLSVTDYLTISVLTTNSAADATICIEYN